MALKLAHELQPASDDEPTLRLDEPITHARELLRLLDANDDRPTMPAPGRRARKRKR